MNRMTREELNWIAGKVFESIEEGIMVTDRAQTIVYVNASFCTLTGYSLDEVVGQSPRLLSSGYHSADFYNEMWETIRETGSWQGEIWNKKKDGELYLEELSITQVNDSDGNLTHYVGIFKDITLRWALEAKIQHQAQHDILTGLPNRILFHDRLHQAIQSADRHQSQVGLMFIDLDRFKQINDSLGHHIGDKLLMQASDRMKQCLRASDTVARIGGDELVVLLPDIAGRQDCSAIAGKIQSLISKPFHIEDNELHVTCSIGISFYPNNSSSSEELIRQADQAMYKAKNAGRNNFQFYSEIPNPAINTFPIEKELRNALETGQLTLFFQPIIRSKLLNLAGAEALIRWNHPSRGLVPPSHFIPIAEDSGLILKLDRWVLRQACNQMVQWHERGHSHLKLGVNISMLQFQQSDFVDTVRRTLSETGLPPSSLILEITERTMMSDPETSVRVMHNISELGVRISLDDFGIGYSSFYHLKQLPVQTLKIDRSYIMDIATSDKDLLIVRALINMAHSLNMTVVAEGVEESKQLELLQQEQCNYIQGYYFDKPLEVSRFEDTYIRLSQD